MNRLAIMLGLAAGLLMGANADAAFIFGVDSTAGSVVMPGTSGQVTVFIDNTGPAATLADTVIVNLNATAGNGASIADLGFTGPVSLAAGTPFNQFFSQNNAPPTTFTFSANSFPAASVPLGRTNLFQLPFALANSAPIGGTFSFDIVPGTISPTGLYNNNVSLGASFAASPEFTMVVAAVPEPASLGLCALAFAGAGGVVRRFRSRGAKTASC